jgi:rhodanese-related sulfurtransferase/mannose-6-phosphate isomerase-like protein (cupin superfamily)
MGTTTDTNVLQIGEKGATANQSAEQILRTPEELAAIVSNFASTNGWIERVQLRSEQRWYERVHHGADHDIWLISWLPGQSTGFHDHGASAGALVVTSGILEEHRAGQRPRVIYPNKPLAFGPEYAHDVRNASIAPAISIHAYSPPLDEMNEFELDGSELVPRRREPQEAQLANKEWRAKQGLPLALRGASNIDGVLAAARAKLRRLSPDEAYKAAKTGATLVDIRPEGQRAAEGEISGALVVERNVLEWRFDPTSDARLPVAVDHDVRVIVFCSEGYTSSLAATALQDLGLRRATDVVGGFQAWKTAGLPTSSGNYRKREIKSRRGSRG